MKHSSTTPAIASAIERPIHRGVYRPFGGGRRKSFARRHACLLWRYTDGLSSVIGPDPVFASAGVTPKGDGTVYAQNVLPVDSEGRGVWVGPGYSNLLKGSAFSGGSQSVAPTGWNLGSADNATVVYDGESATFTTTGGKYQLWQSVSLLANATYRYEADIITDGALRTVDFLYRATVPSNTVEAFECDGEAVGVNYIPSAGTHRVALIFTTTSTGGSLALRFGIGSVYVVTGSVTISRPMFVRSPYQLPYVKTESDPVTVTSAAGSSGGNGMSWLMDARILEALGGDGVNPAMCTVAVEVTVGLGSAEVAADANLLTGRGAVGSLLYSGSGATYASHDGTGAASGAVSGGYIRGERHLRIAQTNAAGTKFRVGNLRVGVDAAIQWSAEIDFDGSFDPLTSLRAAFNGTIPAWLRSVQVWDRPAPDSVILQWGLV